MNESEKTDFFCTRCQCTVSAEDRYCKNCGAIFSDNVFCANHTSVTAEGICVICTKACCKECGGDSNAVFLCNSHWECEIQEGMARVYGSIDNVQSQYVTTCLEQAGLHPFLYSRRFNPGSGMINTWVRAGIRNYGKYPIVELKVLVPFAEVIKAEKTLRKLNIKEYQSS